MWQLLTGAMAVVSTVLELSAAGITFTRTESGAATPGDRPRRLDRTWILAEHQLYTPYKNSLHHWPDRPLFLDRSLYRFPDASSRAFLLDLKVAQDCGLDGFGAIAYYDTNIEHLELLQRKPPELPYLQMPVTCAGSDTGGEVKYAQEKKMIIRHAASPFAPKIDGKIVLWTYGGGSEKQQKWVERLRADPEIPPFMLIGDMPFYDMYQAYGYDNWGVRDPNHPPISAEKIAAFKKKVEIAAKTFDGFQIWCTNYRSEWNGEYPERYSPTGIYREYLLPIALEILARPENRGKLVGTYVRQGYVNHCAGWTNGQYGTESVRNVLNEISLINPDVIMCFEWNEQNENTHFQPTVASGKTMTRILAYYRSLWDRTPPKPMKGDDESIPNLVLSTRQALQVGEIYHLELLFLPDGAAAKEIKAKVTLKDETGAVLVAFPEEKIATDKLKSIDYRIPSEQLADHHVVVPELETEYQGVKRTWTGFDATRLRATTCRDYLYTRQPLREQAVPDDYRLKVAELEDGTYEIKGGYKGQEELASLEVLDDIEEIAAADIEHKFNRNRFAILRCTMTSAELGQKFYGKVLKDNTLRTPGAPNAEVVNAEYYWECFGAREKVDGAWPFNCHFGEGFNTFFVKVPWAELEGSQLQLEIPEVDSLTMPMDEAMRRGKLAWELKGGVRVELERLDNLADIPVPLGKSSAMVVARLKSPRRFPVYQLRAVTRAGKVWRSFPVVAKTYPAERTKVEVYSDTERKGASAKVPTAALPVLDYVFDAGNTAVFRSGWEDRFDGTLGGGHNFDQAMCHASSRRVLPKDYSGEPAPKWVKEEDRDVLEFRKGAYLSFPHEVIPRAAPFALEFEIKPETLENQVLIRTRSVSNDDTGLQLIIRDGRVMVTYFGKFLYTSKECDTQAKLKVGEWNKVRIEKDFKEIRCEVNGTKTRFPNDRRGRLFQGFVFGSNVAPGENVPEGVKPFAGRLRSFRICHGQ